MTDIDAQRLHNDYGQLDDRELALLHVHGGLTDMAHTALEQELGSRGMTKEQILQLAQERSPEEELHPLIQGLRAILLTFQAIRQRYLSYTIHELWVSALCGILGYLFAAPPYGLFGPDILDGPCSGVWGPIAFSCYLPDIFYASLSVWLPACIFRKRAYQVAFLSAGVFVGIWVFLNAFLSILLGDPLRLWGPKYYTPSVFGLWVSIWSVIAASLLVYIFVRSWKRLLVSLTVLGLVIGFVRTISADGISFEGDRVKGWSTTVIVLTADQQHVLDTSQAVRIALTSEQQGMLKHEAGFEPEELHVLSLAFSKETCTCELLNVGIRFRHNRVEVPHNLLGGNLDDRFRTKAERLQGPYEEQQRISPVQAHTEAATLQVSNGQVYNRVMFGMLGVLIVGYCFLALRKRSFSKKPK
jgi:hypothetical protein